MDASSILGGNIGLAISQIVEPIGLSFVRQLNWKFLNTPSFRRKRLGSAYQVKTKSKDCWASNGELMFEETGNFCADLLSQVTRENWNRR
jgi:hypothetical protein